MRRTAGIGGASSAARAYRLMDAAATVLNILENFSHFDPTPESQARPLTALEPEQQPIAWQRAVETAPAGKITAAHVQAVVDDMRAAA